MYSGQWPKTSSPGAFPAKNWYSQTALRDRPPRAFLIGQNHTIIVFGLNARCTPPWLVSLAFLPVFGRLSFVLGENLATRCCPSPACSPGLLAGNTLNSVLCTLFTLYLTAAEGTVCCIFYLFLCTLNSYRGILINNPNVVFTRARPGPPPPPG